VRWRCARAGGRPQRRAPPLPLPHRSPAWPRCIACRRRRLWPHGLAENVAAQVLAVAGSYSHIVFAGHRRRQEHRAPRGGQAGCGPGRPTSPRSISADTFERPIYAGNAIATVQATDAVKVLTVRTTGFDRGSRHWRQRCGRDRGSRSRPSAAVSFVGCEIAKNDRPELTAAKIIVSGGRALGFGEKFTEVMTPLADKLGAAMGASPRGGGRGLRAQRLASGPDRQDRGAPAVRGLRHQRRHPALGRHEGLARSSWPSTRTPKRPSSAWPTTVWKPTCSRLCPN